MANCEYNNINKGQMCTNYQNTLGEKMIETNISEILELVHNTNDIVLLTKAFYTLGLYLLSQESGCDNIIICQFLYDKILLVLNCCLQTRVSVAVDLVSALLLYGDGQGYSRRQTLHVYAENMINTSGCLAAMCNLFTNCMMQRGPLRRVCVSLGVAARSAQAQCAHLVPLCILRCRQLPSEIFSLLESVLCKNDRNIQLFHQNNGMTIFTRESLQHPECLSLLSTLVENTGTENMTILNKTPQVFEILQNVLFKYGPRSITGQWASIILYLRRRARIDLVQNVSHVKNIARDGRIKHSKDEKNTFTCNDDDTTRLFRNVFKEIMTLQKQENNKSLKNVAYNLHRDVSTYAKHNGMDYDLKNVQQNNLICSNTFAHPTRKINLNKNKTNDLSFSFLQRRNETCVNRNKKFTESFKENFQPQNRLEQLNIKVTQTDTELPSSRYLDESAKIDFNITNCTILEFKPRFVSTPKQNRNRFKTTLKSTICSSTLNSLSSRKHHKINKNAQKKYKRRLLDVKPLERNQNKSMSAKFFDLINGSCTTLVKSFNNIKNIFKRKENEENREESTITTEETEIKTSCSYSFTNYMQNRDACVRDIDNSSNDLCEKTNIHCNTCDDTELLRDKLDKDKSLQQTIQRLKHGINLYGCNFKKISKTMWPRETYMTPTVLYNLYRKLIIK